MRAPEFWQQDGLVPLLATPASWLYQGIEAVKRAMTTPWRAPIPVICIGNVNLGGAGKTPTALAVGARLIERGHRVHFLIRGYGGRTRGPLRVDLDLHDARTVGDEALLLARLAPTWVGADRRRSAARAAESGAEILVMDDGFQNPSLVKDLSLVVIDLDQGFGNRRVFPAGPLREPLAQALSRADALVLIGGDATASATVSGAGLPVLRARIVPHESALQLRRQRVAAFAGIARPAKFFDTLDAIGVDVAVRRAFSDHYRYSAEDIMAICEEAAALGAEPVTTEKDYARLDAAMRPMVRAVAVSLVFDSPARLDALLDRARHAGSG
ncbi:MAG: tetraacyldisaccharide 4'-kinase [Alphaproteobacteria bacterium]|nr:tetraacyldisaccharide 4'-kinase [Alphaproteobacteria bacterium]